MANKHNLFEWMFANEAKKEQWRKEAATEPDVDPELEEGTLAGYRKLAEQIDEEPSIGKVVAAPFELADEIPIARQAMQVLNAPSDAISAKALNEGASPLAATAIGATLDPLNFGPTILAKGKKVANLAKAAKVAQVASEAEKLAEASKLAELAKMGDVEARAKLASNPELGQLARADEAQSPLRRRFGKDKVAGDPKLPMQATSPERRAAFEAAQKTNADSVRRRFEPAKGNKGDVITGLPPEPSPSLSLEAQAPGSPVITSANPPPASPPVATPSVAAETAGLEAKKPWWVPSKTTVGVGSGVAAGTAGMMMGKNSQRNADQAALADAEARLKAGSPPPVTSNPNSIPQEPPIPAAPAVKPPSEEDIYDQERQELGGSAIDNLQDAANSIPGARAQAVDPALAADRAAVQSAIGEVNKAADEKVPDRSWNENLGLVLGTIGGALHGGAEVPLRLADRIKQGQREKIGDMQKGADQKLRAAQSGQESTGYGIREARQTGSDRVGDVTKIADLRNAATEVALKIQAERDPRKRQALMQQKALIDSEIAKNKGSASYYESGAKAQRDLAEAEKTRMATEQQRQINELLKSKTSPNRPSAK